MRNDADLSKSAYVLQDVQPDINKPAESEFENTGEDRIGYEAFDKSEKAKSCMDSIGSWINDLFTAPVKRSASCPRSMSKSTDTENLMEEDSEYFKSINTLKEQFKEKLKYETTITLKNKPLVLNFDKAPGSEKKLRKKMKLLSAKNSPETFKDNFEEPNLDRESVADRTKVRRSNANIFTPHSANTLGLGSSNLIKAKKRGNQKNRPESGGLEEYVLPTPAELSKRLLLNVNDIDSKCVQVYKNAHISLQELQHYRKNKSYQTSARCYTTNTNIGESSYSRYFKNVKSERKRNIHVQKTVSDDSFHGKMTKRNSRSKLLTGTVSNFSTEPSTFVKSKSPKSLPNAQAELMKNNANSNSDELVKLLMKKIKVNYRIQPAKKKSTSLTPVVAANKNRFMQSATNSLVISVMAKKENENQLKSNPAGDKKAETEAKPGFPGKDWPMRHIDHNLRFDVRNTGTPPKFNKSSYLAEEERVEGGDCILDKSAKNFYEDSLKNDLSFSHKKHIKRQDVKNMLSKLDARANAFNVLKAKQKINKKKAKAINTLRNSEPKEFWSARYTKEDSAKNNPKSDSEIVDEETDERANKSNETESTSNTGCLSTELALIEPNLPLVPEKPKDLLDCQPAEAEKVQNAAATEPEPEFNVLDCLHYEEKLSNVKTGPPKNKAYKDRLYKTKSLQYIKGESPKSLLGPLTTNNNNETQQTKEFEPTVSSPVKALGIPVLNRRYSSNTLHEPQQHKIKNGTFNNKSAYLSNKEGDGEKSKSVDKRKERSSKNVNSENSSHDKEFGYEKFKKSAPGRDKDKYFS